MEKTMIIFTIHYGEIKTLLSANAAFLVLSLSILSLRRKTPISEGLR